jgi:hypothetical protein
MTDKIDKEIQSRLKAILAEGISDDAMKDINKKVEQIRCDIEDDVMYRLKDDLAPNLACFAAEMAEKAVEMILEGNEDQLRRYLSCEKRGEDGQYIGWTGRSEPPASCGRPRSIDEQHPVIHGKLFEQGCVALRKKIVEAHRGLLANERILDLEDQVKSLVAQLNKANAEKDAMWERFRQYA